LQAYYVTVVEDGPIIVCKMSSSTFGQNLPILQRGFSAIAELLVILITFFSRFFPNILKNKNATLMAYKYYQILTITTQK